MTMFSRSARESRGGGAVLCFHSLTTPRNPAEGSAHVTLDGFKSAIRLSRRLGRLIPLSDFVARYLDGRSTAGLIAITFDDAYRSLDAGFREFISSQSVPVAVFVVTQAADRGSTYWWDRVDDVFPKVSAERWRWFEDACRLPNEYRLGQPREFGTLRPLRQWVLARYQGRWPAELEGALTLLEAEAGIQTSHRSMTFDELQALAAMPEVELGVHTRSHPVLPLLADGELQEEINGGYRALRDHFPAARPILSIPFGLYDARTLRAARASGMAASLTLGGSGRNVHTCPEAVPRVCVSKSDTTTSLGLRLLGVADLADRWRGRMAPEYPALPSATT